MRAAEHLDEGKQNEARAMLDQAQALDPNNPLAKTLRHSMLDNPVQVYGEKSWRYQVRPGDTLSKIAGQYLKNEYDFFLLARYNDIAIPAKLQAGREIRIPGDKPIPVAGGTSAKRQQHAGENHPPAPTAAADARFDEGQRLLKAGDEEGAYAAFAASRYPAARAEADRLRPQLISLHERKAKEAYRKQDPEECVRQWDIVLKLDPGYEVAKQGRLRAMELRDYLTASR